MNDQELLYQAAKAAGEITPSWYNNSAYFEGVLSRWNPLTNDGDAFRLAVKLNMGISIPIHQTIRADVICFKNSAINVREGGDDPYTATRRAIVKVAANIGQTMGGIMSDYIYTVEQELKTVKLQRDELLDMLELVMDEWRIGWRYGSEANGYCLTYNQAIALIAKVKGER